MVTFRVKVRLFLWKIYKNTRSVIFKNLEKQNFGMIGDNSFNFQTFELNKKNSNNF